MSHNVLYGLNAVLMLNGVNIVFIHYTYITVTLITVNLSIYSSEIKCCFDKAELEINNDSLGSWWWLNNNIV